MRYNKLVRDKIHEIIKMNGDNSVTRIASNSEFFEKLKEKLKEEASEYSKDENETELADILEVINAICDYKKISKNKLELLRKKRAKERGAYKKRIILEETN